MAKRAPRVKHAQKRRIRAKVNGSKTTRIVHIQGPGRASSYDPEKHPVIARQMTKLGATDSDLAQAFEISTGLLSIWKRKHPEFMDALQLGKEIADQEVVRSLYARAIGYEHTATRFFVIEGEIIPQEYIERYPPDVKAQEFWLTNRKPSEWRKNHESDDKKEGVHINITGGLPDKL